MHWFNLIFKINFDILHRCKKSVQIIVYVDRMDNNNDKEHAIRQDDKIVTSKQKEDGRRPSIKGRPNIDEISKRNEEEQRRDRRSFYSVTGIIVLIIILMIIFAMFLVDFFG